MCHVTSGSTTNHFRTISIPSQPSDTLLNYDGTVHARLLMHKEIDLYGPIQWRHGGGHYALTLHMRPMLFIMRSVLTPLRRQRVTQRILVHVELSRYLY